MKSAILAGGAATRFDGKPKGLEKVGGERILDRLIRSVQVASGSAPLLVANDDRAATWAEGLTVKKDLMPGCGALGGIYTALAESTEPVLIVAWDMPFIPGELLELLIKNAGEYDVYLPESLGPRGVEPLCGVYGPGATNPLLAALVDEDFRTDSFHDKVRVGSLPLDDVKRFGDPETIFFNVNSPSELEQAEELWRNKHA
ncbi:MAG: molybdenum cofactor guanylyltransferase [Gemmatimonadetes bacterium]|nr:molybdenum cofactor guanylyltransferase [Gemmatimonadota bacterium]